MALIFQRRDRNKQNAAAQVKSGRNYAINTRAYSVMEEHQRRMTEETLVSRPGRMDRGIIVLTFCLIAIGILMVYSSSHLLSSRHYNGYSYRYLQIHMIACAIGLAGMFVTSYLPYRFYAKHANLLLILAFVGLLACFRAKFGSQCTRGRGGTI